MAVAIIGLSACGQKGDLYLPTEPEAAQRATLPRSVLPVRPRTPTALPPTPPTSQTPSAPQPAASAPRH